MRIHAPAHRCEELPAIRDRGERRTAGGRSGPRPLCVAVCWAVRTAPTSCHHTAQLAFLWAQIREVLRRHCVERGESTQQRCRVWQRLQHLPGHVVVGTMRGLAGWLVCRQEASRRGWRGIWRKTKHEHERHDGPRKHHPPDRRHGERACARPRRLAGAAGLARASGNARVACRGLQGGNAAHSYCATCMRMHNHMCVHPGHSMAPRSHGHDTARSGELKPTRPAGDSLGIEQGG